MQKFIARFLTPLLEHTGNEELRRAIVTRNIALAGVILGVGYAALNASLGIWNGAAANLLFSVLWMLIAVLSGRGHINKSRHLMLVLTNLHLTLTALYIFGPECGGHHYLLASATVGSLFFTMDEWRWKIFYLFFGLFFFLMLEYEWVAYRPLETISSDVAQLFEMVSIVGTVAFIFVFLMEGSSSY